MILVYQCYDTTFLLFASYDDGLDRWSELSTMVTRRWVDLFQGRRQRTVVCGQPTAWLELTLMRGTEDAN